MPNIKSAKKRVLTAEKRAKSNLSKRSALKTYVKKAKIAIATGNENSTTALKDACVKIDKAAAKGLIHKNTAARRKSRLVKALNAKAAE